MTDFDPDLCICEPCDCGRAGCLFVDPECPVDEHAAAALEDLDDEVLDYDDWWEQLAITFRGIVDVELPPFDLPEGAIAP